MLVLATMATATNIIGIMCSSLDSVAPPPSVRADSTYVIPGYGQLRLNNP